MARRFSKTAPCPKAEDFSKSEWAQYRRAQQARRMRRLPTRAKKILALVKEGFRVEQLTPYQFRVNGRLDLYPIHNLWHDTKTNQRGGHRNLAVFAREWVKQ